MSQCGMGRNRGARPRPVVDVPASSGRCLGLTELMKVGEERAEVEPGKGERVVRGVLAGRDQHLELEGEVGTVGVGGRERSQQEFVGGGAQVSCRVDLVGTGGVEASGVGSAEEVRLAAA